MLPFSPHGFCEYVSPPARIMLIRARAFKTGLYQESRIPYNDAFYDSFSNALKAMPNLSELDLDLYQNQDVVAKLRSAFTTSEVTLPSVKILRLSAAPNTAFILKACPFLETFIAFHIHKKWKSTYAPLPSMKSLRRVEFDPCENWTPRRLRGQC